jgi:hypothetical protein
MSLYIAVPRRRKDVKPSEYMIGSVKGLLGRFFESALGEYGEGGSASNLSTLGALEEYHLSGRPSL